MTCLCCFVHTRFPLNLPNDRAGDPPPKANDAPPSNAAPIQALLNSRALAALRHREFRLLWYGNVFTSMATWMDSIARGWLWFDRLTTP